MEASFSAKSSALSTSPEIKVDGDETQLVSSIKTSNVLAPQAVFNKILSSGVLPIKKK